MKLGETMAQEYRPPTLLFASAVAFLNFPVSNVTSPTHSGALQVGSRTSERLGNRGYSIIYACVLQESDIQGEVRHMWRFGEETAILSS